MEKQSSVGQLFGLVETMINIIWGGKNRVKQSIGPTAFGSDSEHLHPFHYKNVHTALLAWFKQARSINIPISSLVQIEKATTLAW